MFLSNYRYGSINQSLHRTISVCEGRIEEPTFCFDPFNRIVTVEIFQKLLVILISLILQICNSQPPPVRLSRSTIQSKKQNLWINILLEIPCFSLLFQVRDSPKIPMKRFSFYFSRCSISYFTKVTGFILRSGQHRNVLVVENFSMGDLSSSIPCITVLTV